MATAPVLQWVVTANYTRDGAVAYLRADKTFSRVAAEAAVFATKDEADAMRKFALTVEPIVADPYLMEVVVTPQGLDLLSARERIRAAGPTVRVRRPDPQLASR
jgi:Protein of unknown function (DUF2849)